MLLWNAMPKLTAFALLTVLTEHQIWRLSFPFPSLQSTRSNCSFAHTTLPPPSDWIKFFYTSPSKTLDWIDEVVTRLRVVPHFSSGIVEWAKRERAWKSPHARKGDARRGESLDFVCSPSFFSLPSACRLFSRGWFSHAPAFRSLYYPWGKMGTTRSLSCDLSMFYNARV